MNKNRIIAVLLFIISWLVVALAIKTPAWLNVNFNWGLIAAVFIGLLILAMFFEFEARNISNREIALISMIGALSAILRIPFAPLPNVQPSTFIIICTGYVFGPMPGFMTGAITALVSNLMLGHGPWTLFQILAWGMSGCLAGLLGRLKVNIWILAALGFLWGYIFGLITNLWFWSSLVYPLTWQTLLISQLNSIWFDTLHGLANLIFMAVLGKRMIRLLQRYHQRFFWRYVNVDVNEQKQQPCSNNA
jgi:energy-coupling factor transport system substrate-specific component